MKIKDGDIVRINRAVVQLPGTRYEVITDKNEYIKVDGVIDFVLNYGEMGTYVGGTLLTGANKGMFISCSIQDVEVLSEQELQTIKVLYGL